ncbi:MAG TPA: hypothetical protein VHK01_05345 [Lacipirellulaceae bacterium]|jgi:hypothetical protein|nr:hypothetical protein [Lacipirellulaceae bacterium]
MRVIIFLAIVVALLAFAGWITFSSGPDRASINVETNEIRQDTQEIVRSGAKVLDKTKVDLQPADRNADTAEREASSGSAEREYK